MNRRHAFTLPELLVVILIVFVLLGLLSSLIPARPSEKARRTQCLNNLRQIGLASAQYASDYGDRLPSGKNSVFENAMLLSNVLGSVKVLVCPSSPKKAATGFEDVRATDTANVSYTQQAALTTGMIWKANAGEVLFWDQGVAGNPCGPSAGIGLSWAKTSNHKGAGGNVLFGDGHVSFQIKTPTNMPLGCLNP